MMKTGGLNHECLLYSAGEQWTCTNQPSVYLTDIDRYSIFSTSELS